MIARWWTLVVVALVLAVLGDPLAPVALAGMPVQDAGTGTGSIRGRVDDADFGLPLAAVQVLVVEANRTVQTSSQGNYLVSGLAPGTYTVIFTKDGFDRLPVFQVLVTSGGVRDLDVELTGKFNEMNEFVVEDVLQLGAGTELALLQLRFDSPALLDSISSDLMSRAGLSDAADGLKLVSGATVQDGKFAVIRGLPDRYVSSQLNGVRLPTADEDKRAVELDQFPSAVLESLQVSKTFTPDQQGDASGGAVDVRLKGIPDETVFKFSSQVSINSQVAGRDDFLTYEDPSLNYWGNSGGNDVQPTGGNWTGAVGISRETAPLFDYKYSFAAGGSRELDSGVRVGGLASFFYETDTSYYEKGRNDSYLVRDPGGPLVPKPSQGTLQQGEFQTALFDIDQGSRSVQWGGLATIGLESEFVKTDLIFFYNRTAEDKVTLAEDTRGKRYFIQETLGTDEYDPNDPSDPGHAGPNLDAANRLAAPYIRTETLAYTERTTTSLQWTGAVSVPLTDFGWDGLLDFSEPEVSWNLSTNRADQIEPDKRQFGSVFLPETRFFIPGIIDILQPAEFIFFRPAASVNLGNLQRTFKEIIEENDQLSLGVTFPFEQWDGRGGSLSFGLFADRLERTFDQDSYTNGNGDPNNDFAAPGGFGDFWSASFPNENHAIVEFASDVDYEGTQDITALYGMIDLPLSEQLRLITGARFERTRLAVTNFPEANALWVDPGDPANGIPPDEQATTLEPGEADVPGENIDEVLPSIGLVWEPFRDVTLRAAYSKTIARQTFKEVTPVLQQEFLGGPLFVGNPNLEQSQIDNFDLRLDYVPYEGGIVSVSWFAKDIEGAIEYVQVDASLGTYTSPFNYPKGELSGYELEVRQDLGRMWDRLDGLSIGSNATFIRSEVELTDREKAEFAAPGIAAPLESRDMTQAPEYLYNIFATYDVPESGTQLTVFYTVQGDTLVAGASATDDFVPSVYALAYDTLNMSLTQELGPYLKLKFQAKNLTNPTIDEVYRSQYIGGDTIRTSRTRGIDYSISLSASFAF
ncbi:TonB dependent receptor [Planctomycetes bacterium Pla163]|uniref:TonB dependent receptor n=1 Tax=Rohdeia mirabilis TaxID=2528008 RepID=A0A518CXJ4_9BACT|nr:TonB dependent receptor [Planctomycetes bacterium Pla163]